MSIKIVFGGGAFITKGSFRTVEAVNEALDALKKSGVDTIDTARLYVGSEELIGQAHARENFTIDTKLKGGFEAGTAKKDIVIRDAQDSYDLLKVSQFDILYLHAPDALIPLEETLEGINEVYKKGYFRRFGLSNFTAAQVQEAYDIAKSKGWVLPTVYQGNYSPIARHLETLLFPTLRKLGIAFYAYSPLAGGFLTKTTQQLDEGVGRFNSVALGGLYKKLYDRPSLRGALATWNSIAEKEGVSKAELAYRWVGYNSALKAELGDAVIFGASKLEQIEETPRGLRKGALSAEAVSGIQEIWERIKDDAPVDNFGANKL